MAARKEKQKGEGEKSRSGVDVSKKKGVGCRAVESSSGLKEDGFPGGSSHPQEALMPYAGGVASEVFTEKCRAPVREAERGMAEGSQGKIMSAVSVFSVGHGADGRSGTA